MADYYAVLEVQRTALEALRETKDRRAVGPLLTYLSNGPEPLADLTSAVLQAIEGARIVVDLQTQCITAPDGSVHAFQIDTFSRRCLLDGMDEIDYTLTLTDRIADFERRYDALAG